MNEDNLALAQRRRNRVVIIALTTVLLALMLAMTLLAHSIGTSGSASRPSSQASQFFGPVFPADLRAASFWLTDQDGKRATLLQYRGRVLVLTFIHSHCRDACPLMTTEIRGALDQLPHQGRDVPVLGISVDPFHDTRASARAFLARQHMTGRMRFLLGRFARLRPIWRHYAIQPEVDAFGHELSGGHSAYVMLIDRRGFLRVGFPAGNLVPEDLAHDLKLLLDHRGPN
ncbi:MAG: SCO family protein [Solirubrobacteraceae bacterium]